MWSKSRHRRTALLGCALAILIHGPTRADEHELAAFVEAARGTFQPITADDIAAAKASVRERLIEVDWSIGRGSAWRDYLMWSEQFEAFDREDVGTADLWRHVYSRVARDTDLFENDVFQRYRQALQDLFRRIHAHEHSDLQGEYQAVLTELAELLAHNQDGLKNEDLPRVSELLTKLDRQRQAPQLIKAVRQLATQPNVVLHVPAKLFAESRHFEENYTFRQNIRGTSVSGNGILVADQTFTLEPNPDAILVRSNVSGVSNSISTGYGNGVAVRSAGSLNFESAANIVVKLDGVTSTGFDTRGRLASRILGMSLNYSGRAASIARQTVYNRQEADRRAAQGQALASLDTSFNQRLNDSVEPLQTSYQRNVYLPLLRHDRLPQQSSFASDEQQATARMWLADNAQLAAVSAPPWSADTGEFVRLAVHESAINNTSALLEGRVRSLVSVLNGKFFEYIAETAMPSDRVDIRFHDAVAARAILRDGAIELRLVGTEYILDGSTYPGMEITLRYHVDQEQPTRLRLSEPPLVETYSPDGAERPRTGLRGIALRRILANVLREQVDDTIDLTEITLSEPFEQLGKFETQRIDVQNGWLILEVSPQAVDASEASIAAGAAEANTAAGAAEANTAAENDETESE